MRTASTPQAPGTQGVKDPFYCRVSNRVISRCPRRDGVDTCPLRGECLADRGLNPTSP